MTGVSLINSLREKWCMGLLSRQSGWKEKPTVPFPVACFLPFYHPLFTKWVSGGSSQRLLFVYFPLFLHQRTGRLHGTSRDCRVKTPTRWGRATPMALSSESPHFYCSPSLLADQHGPLRQDKLLLTIHSGQCVVLGGWPWVQTASSY